MIIKTFVLFMIMLQFLGMYYIPNNSCDCDGDRHGCDEYKCKPKCVYGGCNQGYYGGFNWGYQYQQPIIPYYYYNYHYIQP